MTGSLLAEQFRNAKSTGARTEQKLRAAIMCVGPIGPQLPRVAIHSRTPSLSSSSSAAAPPTCALRAAAACWGFAGPCPQMCLLPASCSWGATRCCHRVVPPPARLQLAASRELRRAAVAPRAQEIWLAGVARQAPARWRQLGGEDDAGKFLLQNEMRIGRSGCTVGLPFLSHSVTARWASVRAPATGAEKPKRVEDAHGRP
ncbi:unnamed protein product [Urochloa humidicola]